MEGGLKKDNSSSSSQPQEVGVGGGEGGNVHPVPMGSIGPECTELKRAYDACFNAWFADKFLKGHPPGLDSCDPLLSAYTDCVKKALKARHVDLGEIAMAHLGTDKVRTPPTS